MKTFIFAMLLTFDVCSAVMAQTESKRTVMLMAADDDTIVQTFDTDKACADLHEVRMFEKGGPIFDWSLAVAGNGRGKYEVLLMDNDKHGAWLGTNYRKGTHDACLVIRGVKSAKWFSLEATRR